MSALPIAKVEWTLSSACEDDHDDMTSLYRQSIKNNRKGFIQDLHFHGCICCMSNDMQAAGGDMLTMRISSNLVGMGGLKRISDKRVELCKLHVDSAYQGYGYGKLLTIALIERAKQLYFREIELHVTKTQKAAINLYTRLGFQKDKEEVYKTNINGRNIAFDTLYMSRKL